MLDRAKAMSELLDQIDIDTSIKKLIKIVYKIFSEEYSDFQEEKLKEDIKTFKYYGINKLRDLVDSKERINLYNQLKLVEIDEIAVVLYPKYILNIDANEFLARRAFEIKNNFFQDSDKLFDKIITQAKDEDKLQEVYNDLYHGFNIPEAPPAPFNYPHPFDYWENEFEEYRPRRKERIKKLK